MSAELVSHVSAHVEQLARLNLGVHLPAAPLLEEVRRVVRLQCNGDLGLQLFVLHGGDLDRAVTPGCASSNSVATSCQKPLAGSAVPLCHHVSVTSSPAAAVSPPVLQPLSAATARPAAVASATSRVLRLFIIEPFESFDNCVERNLDLLNIRRNGYAVKRNIFDPGREPPCRLAASGSIARLPASNRFDCAGTDFRCRRPEAVTGRSATPTVQLQGLP